MNREAQTIAVQEGRSSGANACRKTKDELFPENRDAYRARILRHMFKTQRPLSCTARFFDGFQNERVLRGALAYMMERGEITASLRKGYTLTERGRKAAMEAK